MTLRSRDFESRASANFTTPAHQSPRRQGVQVVNPLPDSRLSDRQGAVNRSGRQRSTFSKRHCHSKLRTILPVAAECIPPWNFFAPPASKGY